MVDIKGKTATGALGVVLGAVIALMGGDSFEDLAARIKGEEPLKTVALRLAKSLCALPEAERIGEWASLQDQLAEEDKSWAAPACDAEEQATGPADAEEVEEAAAALEKEAEEQAVENAEAVEAEVAEVVEEEAAEAGEATVLETLVNETGEVIDDATGGRQ